MVVYKVFMIELSIFFDKNCYWFVLFGVIFSFNSN